MHAAITPRGFAQPSNPPGRVHTAGDRATYREMCRHVSPRFRLHPHLLSPRPPAAAAVEAAAAVAVRLKIPHPLRTARVPTIVLPSRGFSCCCTFSLRRDTTLPACSYTFTIGTFRRWWYSSLPFSTFGGWRLFPTGLSLCPSIELWSSSHPAPREQGPAPISSPMKLHWSLLFASSRVFVSPVQPALLPGNPRADGFDVLIIGLPQGRDKEE